MPVNPATTGQYDHTVTDGWYGYRQACPCRHLFRRPVFPGGAAHLARAPAEESV